MKKTNSGIWEDFQSLKKKGKMAREIQSIHFELEQTREKSPPPLSLTQSYNKAEMAPAIEQNWSSE